MTNLKNVIAVDGVSLEIFSGKVIQTVKWFLITASKCYEYTQLALLNYNIRPKKCLSDITRKEHNFRVQYDKVRAVQLLVISRNNTAESTMH